MFQKKVSTDSLSITVTQQAFCGSKLRVVWKLSWCTVHDSAVENLDNPLHPIKHNKHQFPPRCQSYRCFLLRNWSTIHTWLASASNEGGSTWEGWGGGGWLRRGLILCKTKFIHPTTITNFMKIDGRFHVAERLFSNRSQMASKWVKNKIVAQEDHLKSAVTFYCADPRQHGICLFYIIKKQKILLWRRHPSGYPSTDHK